MTNAQATTYLRKHKACDAALEWFGDRDPRIAWETCNRADWMMWITTRCGLRTDAARDTFYAAVKPAWDTYDAAVKLAWDTYVAAEKQARDTYDAAVKPAWDTYDAAVKLARDTYDAVCCDAIRSLISFDAIAKAIENEATQ